MKTPLEYKVSFVDNSQHEKKGILKITEDYLIFEPFAEELKVIKEAMYRLVQTGFRKKFRLIPYKLYVKTMSGKVLYFKTPKAKEIFKIIEKAIYF